MILFCIPSDKVISKIHLYKGDDVQCVRSMSEFDNFVADGYRVFEEPDPLFNPNEVTRVSDIMTLHRKGVSTNYVGDLRGELVQPDTRTLEQQMNSPNIEADKLFPSFARLSSQNVHYKSTLDQQLDDVQQQVDAYNNHVDLINLQSSTNTNNNT